MNRRHTSYLFNQLAGLVGFFQKADGSLMKLVPKLRSVRRGKRPELSAMSTTISDKSSTPGLPSTFQKMSQSQSTSSTRSRLQGKRQTGQRSTRGIGSGPPTPRQRKL